MPEINIPEIRDIAPPLPPEVGWPPAAWAGIALAAAVLAALVALLLVRARRRPGRPVPAPPADPRASALAKLQALAEDESGLPANQFAHRASQALREYLAGSYGAASAFETGREFIARQGATGLVDEHKLSAIAGLFGRTESLQFAPAPGADALRPELLRDLIAFVSDDVPAPKLKLHAPGSPHPEDDSDADPLPA